jgi:hypothetical protein
MQILVNNLQGERLLVRPRYAWEDNIKVDHQEIIMCIGFSWFLDNVQ